MSRYLRSFSITVIAVLLGIAPTLVCALQPSGMLSRLVSSLESESQAVHADFAAVALGEMITAYELELDQLSEPGQVSRGEIAKQIRWGRALGQFLDDLYAAREELDAGAGVELLVSPPASVQILVGERLVAISSLRLDSPQSIEQRVAQVYCDLFACLPEVFDTPDAVAEPLAKRGGWSFVAGQGSTYETADGLGFMFTDVRNRMRKEQICLRIAEELDRLSKTLAQARRQGRKVDLQTFLVESSGRGDDQRVRLSTSGESVRVRLPTIVQTPDLLEVARVWVAARSEGKDFSQRFPRAERLMATFLPNGQGTK
ncbi:MAG: hypothetical protein ACI9DC_003074 [Gammaproteobacteria bacterium]|jgi:hypothetical protein